MSGPNTDYDPVEVTPLQAEQVAAMRDEALAAIAAAPRTSTRSSRPASTTRVTAHRWPWPTARSARCRRRPARRPASASARPAAR